MLHIEKKEEEKIEELWMWMSEKGLATVCWYSESKKGQKKKKLHYAGPVAVGKE